MRCPLVADNAEPASVFVSRRMLDGHAVDHADSLARAEDCRAMATHDLILLDVMLPDGDGRDGLTRRRAHLDTPVIMLAARAQVSDRVGALDQGADDEITKPFDFSRLGARGALPGGAASPRGAARNEMALGAAVFDPMSGTISHAGRSVDLLNRDIRQVQNVARNPGRILSRAHLMDRPLSMAPR